MNISSVPHNLPPQRAFAKWFACALVLLLPGSFIVLALLWILRRRAPPGGQEVVAREGKAHVYD